jgi:hypothetical protein
MWTAKSGENGSVLDMWQDSQPCVLFMDMEIEKIED